MKGTKASLNSTRTEIVAQSASAYRIVKQMDWGPVSTTGTACTLTILCDWKTLCRPLIFGLYICIALSVRKDLSSSFVNGPFHSTVICNIMNVIRLYGTGHCGHGQG